LKLWRAQKSKLQDKVYLRKKSQEQQHLQEIKQILLSTNPVNDEFHSSRLASLNSAGAT